MLQRFAYVQVVEGRRWQLEAMRGGFCDNRVLIVNFLNLLRAGPPRRRFISGQEVDTYQLLKLLTFDDNFDKVQSTMVKETVSKLKDEEAQLFFRTVTGLNSIPQDCVVTVIPKATSGAHPFFSTCFYQVVSVVS